ncbi:MAG: hypothetical protein VKJ04_10025 [Vampirovibrionales bacterium]|nr:hypothetical protein [Vampirovibrionales bacterium]
MHIQFASATMADLHRNPRPIVQDKTTGIAFRPIDAEAIEGGRLTAIRDPLGYHQLAPNGRPMLQGSNNSSDPVYFKILGTSPQTNQPVTLIVPFDNLGIDAKSNQLDIVG